jgi:hypothetical protein
VEERRPRFRCDKYGSFKARKEENVLFVGEGMI